MKEKLKENWIMYLMMCLIILGLCLLFNSKSFAAKFY